MTMIVFLLHWLGYMGNWYILQIKTILLIFL